MGRGKAEDAGGLTPAKGGNAALYHFDPRTLPIFKCVDYKLRSAQNVFPVGRAGLALKPLPCGSLPRRALCPSVSSVRVQIHVLRLHQGLAQVLGDF